MSSKPHLPSNVENVEWIGPESWPYAISGLIHCALIPEEAEADTPVPAIVMLHGWSGNESAMWLFKQVIPKGVAIITPRAPLELEEGKYSWFQHKSPELPPNSQSCFEAVEKLEKFLNNLPEIHPIDPQRILLMGFSQGGAAINSLVTTQAEIAEKMVIGVASLSSLVPDLSKLSSTVDSLAGLPVFIAHGSRDSVVPLESAHQTRDLYQKLDATITYGEYDVGHKMNSEAMSDLKAWIKMIL